MKRINQGIYGIFNKRTGWVYVGQTSRGFSIREGEHFTSLEHGTHENERLQKDFKRYGRDAFEFRVLERCSSNLDRKERLWM